MADDDMKMDEDEFLRANFFMPDNEFAAEQAKRDARARKAEQRKARRKNTVGIKALATFARVLETLDPRERHANIAWLADKYLGVRIDPREKNS